MLVYLVAVAELVLTDSIILIGSDSVPPHRLRPILLHTDAMLQSYTAEKWVTCNGMAGGHHSSM